MAYKRKTHDEWWIYSDYGYGMEPECRAEDPRDAKRLLKEYRENAYGATHIIKKCRVRNEEV